MTASFQKVVLTGACGGLGQALARELIGQCAAVALVGLNRPVLLNTALKEVLGYVPGKTSEEAFGAFLDARARQGRPIRTAA